MAIDFTMTEEQELLLSSIRELINNEFPEEYVRTHDEEGKYPREFVKALAENGISLLGVPEEHGGIPADLNYEGYPKSVCTSINDVVCHGIPSEDDVLREGDIVNVDCSTILDGYYSDSSRMFRIGEVSPERARLVDETKKAMEAGLAAIEPWGLLGDVGAAVNAYAKAQGFSVVREFGGHGVGFDFHEDPFVSHVSEPGTGMVLVPGLVFTIEPMVNAGEAPIDMSDPNGWTVRTADGSDTAQWEVQVAITEDGHELLSW